MAILYPSNGDHVGKKRKNGAIDDDEKADLVTTHKRGYTVPDFGKAENRFLRGDPAEEESPNTKGRDAA
jgi:hypothetical protein